MKTLKQASLSFLAFILVILSFMLSSQIVGGVGGWMQPVGTILLGSVGGGAVIALMRNLSNENNEGPKL